MNEVVHTVVVFIAAALAWIAAGVLSGTALLLGLPAVVVHIARRRRGKSAPSYDAEAPATGSPPDEPPDESRP
ncbi:hypothetical protein [Streptomyces cylindrosporus]|uniref:Uncharacterized protein n=1 Tax=Streptomyces cylindrosporus TaxID=2927583 RepID=A0ABS9YK57_9ACTN|nr:hypothetical protein [Streptomyces cylindrosporus]MCI3277579.1 hypothetical protein [Streptomyces cylindrosporus]